jgi:hypothetical protein
MGMGIPNNHSKPARAILSSSCTWLINGQGRAMFLGRDSLWVERLGWSSGCRLKACSEDGAAFKGHPPAAPIDCYFDYVR